LWQKVSPGVSTAAWIGVCFWAASTFYHMSLFLYESIAFFTESLHVLSADVTQLCFSWSVSCLGPHLEHTLLNSSSSWTIAFAKPTLMHSFAAVSTIVTVPYSFYSLCFVHLRMWIDDLFTSSTPVRPILKILIHSYTLYSGKQLCP
jgi:hypothetical protein